jgi:hypothetical protein
MRNPIKTAPGTYTAGDMPDERLSRGNGQKARTLSEEGTRWGVRLRRWKRKHAGPEANGQIEAMRDAAPEAVTKDATGLLFWRYKAEKAVGGAKVAEIIAATIAYRN